LKISIIIKKYELMSINIKQFKIWDIKLKILTLLKTFNNLFRF